jgi:hypothetical protein
VHRHPVAVLIGHQRAHRFGILGPEIEDLADLDGARAAAPFFGHLVANTSGIMGLVGAGIGEVKVSSSTAQAARSS